MTIEQKRVPQLRFRDSNGQEFTEWEESILSNAVKIFDSKRVPLSESERQLKKGIYPYYGASGIIDYIDDYIFDGEYIILSEDGANILARSTRVAFLAKGKFWINNHAHIFQATKENLNYFIAESLERIRYEEYNTGTVQPKLNIESCKKIKLNLPKLNEQQKIANFLSAVNEKIILLQQKKTAWESYKKGTMQQLFSQQIRFKDDEGQEFPEWEHMKLNSFLRLDIEEVIKPSCNYLGIGIRSHFKGTFQKRDEDPAKNSMSTLFRVKENYLIVNITFAWEGAVAITKEIDAGGLVSHRFPMYKLNENKMLTRFFTYVYPSRIFLEQLKLCSPGGAGRNRVLNKKDFLSIEVNTPISIKEQKKIADFLSSVDDKISAIDKQITTAQEWKKGLMQQMFI